MPVATRYFLPIILRVALRRDAVRIPLPAISRRPALAGLILGMSLFSAVIQYGLWAIRPAYTVVNASRQVGADLPAEGVILGGVYAPALSLENELPAVSFFSQAPPAAIRAGEFTHLAIDVASPIRSEPPSIEWLAENFPAVRENTIVAGPYEMREFVVHVFQWHPDMSNQP